MNETSPHITENHSASANYLIQRPDERITVTTLEEVNGDPKLTFKEDGVNWMYPAKPEILSPEVQGYLANKLGYASLVRADEDYERYGEDDSILEEVSEIAAEFSERVEPLIDTAMIEGRKIENLTDDLRTLITRLFAGNIDKTTFMKMSQDLFEQLQAVVTEDEATATEVLVGSKKMNSAAIEMRDDARRRDVQMSQDAYTKASQFEMRTGEIEADSRKYVVANEDIAAGLANLRQARQEYGSDPRGEQYYQDLFRNRLNSFDKSVSDRHRAVSMVENQLGFFHKVPSKVNS